MLRTRQSYERALIDFANVIGERPSHSGPKREPSDGDSESEGLNMRVAALELSDHELRDAAMAARAAAWRAQHDANNQPDPRSNATFAAIAARYAAIAERFEQARRSLPTHSAK